jgi:branched-chain amino acid transport system ATP-binding protein
MTGTGTTDPVLDTSVDLDVATIEEIPTAAQRRGPAGERLLDVRGLRTSFHTRDGVVRAVTGIDFHVDRGEIMGLVGESGCGKSVTSLSIMGLVGRPGRVEEGEVLFDGQPIGGRSTTEIVGRGVTMVPENRRLFTRMTVRENLELGSYLRTDKAKVKEDLDRVMELFPRVRERLHQKAGTLSGGEQQMVAMSRALMADPKVLLMDEPSMGLAPVLVDQVFEIIQDINKLGTTIFVVEQNANMALSIADRGYVLQTGQIVLADTAEALLENPLMREAYLGELT